MVLLKNTHKISWATIYATLKQLHYIFLFLAAPLPVAVRHCTHNDYLKMLV